jgi:hypothetical protein
MYTIMRILSELPSVTRETFYCLMLEKLQFWYKKMLVRKSNFFFFWYSTLRLVLQLNIRSPLFSVLNSV